jgi:hydrogenase/urease accessory protein HupE
MANKHPASDGDQLRLGLIHSPQIEYLMAARVVRFGTLLVLSERRRIQNGLAQCLSQNLSKNEVRPVISY